LKREVLWRESPLIWDWRVEEQREDVVEAISVVSFVLHKVCVSIDWVSEGVWIITLLLLCNEWMMVYKSRKGNRVDDTCWWDLDHVFAYLQWLVVALLLFSRTRLLFCLFFTKLNQGQFWVFTLFIFFLFNFLVQSFLIYFIF
jgi:hypothetical protein